MATMTAQHGARLSRTAGVAIAAVAGLVLGLVVGYALLPREASSTARTVDAAQQAADNAVADRWIAAIDGGDRAAFDALVRPNIRFHSTAMYDAKNADELWGLFDNARTVDKQGHVRTTDVHRIDDVLVWGAEWSSPGGTPTPSVVMVRLDPQGRFVTMSEALH
jgi:hypothetical protein